MKFVIKDYLQNKNYAWPVTAVSYPVDGDFDCSSQLYHNGEKIPFQAYETPDGLKYVTFYSSLKCGGEENFEFRAEEQKETCAESNTGIYQICFDTENLFEIHCGEQKIIGNTACDEKKIICLEKGEIYSLYKVKCTWFSGGEYKLYIKIYTRLPYFEIREEMSGFNDADEACMEIKFINLDIKSRRTLYRNEEKIDRYLDENNTLPIRITSFDTWINWRQTRYIDFYGKKNAGIFVLDSLDWDDNQYRIWSADMDFGIYFKYDGELEGYFPMKNGKRSVGVSIFEGMKSESLYTHELWKYYNLLNLNKVKDWILDWNTENAERVRFFNNKHRNEVKPYIKFFERDEQITAEKFLDVLENKCESLSQIALSGPVALREVADLAAAYDLIRDEMSEEQHKKCMAAFAFMAYVCMDENFMPSRNMLGGHPNFIMDVKAVTGYAAALFPEHPMRKVWTEHFNRIVDLNMTYHIRPDIEKWNAKGGRATENPTCYNNAFLMTMMRVFMLFGKCGYSITIDNIKAEKWLNWQTNILSAPVGGKRIYMPQGAHADTYEISFYLYEFAKLLLEKYPQTANNFIAIANKGELKGLGFFKIPEEDIWYSLSERVETDEEPHLKSEKFNGYGYILRSSVGTPQEVSVHIQQIDRGPNYRWGCFRNDGNGGIFYIADNKQYSYNSPESTGDNNLGANEGSCNFAVLDEHTYRNIGYNELKNPLIDLNGIKAVKLDAEKEIQRLYKYKEILLIEDDYILIYNAVRDMTTRGRFAWFVREEDDFPNIIQIKPSAPMKNFICPKSIDVIGDGCSIMNVSENTNNIPEMFRTKGIAFDGNGDFLNIVSHHKDLKAEKCDFGAVIETDGRTDWVFTDSARIDFKESGKVFRGKTGVISVYNTDEFKMAVIDGEMIGCEEIKISVSEGISAELCKKNTEIFGEIFAVRDGTVKVDVGAKTISFKTGKGKYTWRLRNDKIVIVPIKDNYKYDPDNDFVRDTLRHEYGFNGFNFDEKRKILEY